MLCVFGFALNILYLCSWMIIISCNGKYKSFNWEYVFCIAKYICRIEEYKRQAYS